MIHKFAGSLHTPNSAFPLCLGNFAMSLQGLFCQGNRTGAEHLSQPVGPSPVPLLWLGSCNLALNSRACLQNHAVVASTVAMCFRGCLYLHEPGFCGLWWEKEHPGASGGGILGILNIFFSTRGLVPCREGAPRGMSPGISH